MKQSINSNSVAYLKTLIGKMQIVNLEVYGRWLKATLWNGSNLTVNGNITFSVLNNL